MQIATVERFAANPLVTPESDPAIGDNINGPSLIRVPEWAPTALGRYYLYFAHHAGDSIRLAYANDLSGPWCIHRPGVMSLDAAGFTGHIASPDVHIDHVRRRFVMYFHGAPADYDSGQASAVALSSDGVSFARIGGLIGRPYFRVFHFSGWWYAIAIPGWLYRSAHGLADFEKGPLLFDPATRHFAVHHLEGAIDLFYSVRGDTPERILVSRVDTHGDWMSWTASPGRSVLEPATEYEGADLPLVPSVKGRAPGRVRQLRDPGIFTEDGRVYLIYSVAGESGLAIAELIYGIS